MPEPRPWPCPPPPEGTPDGFAYFEQDGWEWYADSEAARGVSVRMVAGGVADNEETLRGRAGQALTTLEQAAANWDSLTAAQKDDVLKLVCQVDARLIRLLLRQFGSPGP